MLVADARTVGRSIWQAPAVQALMLQMLAALIVLLGLKFLTPFYPVNLYAAALMQGVCAALLSWWRRLDVWWSVIQFVFPIALVITLGMHLPPVLFLTGFLISILLYWSTYRTQVPYFPSNPEVWCEVAKLLPASAAPALVDIGSGMGGLLFYIAKQRADAVLLGVELAPLPFFISRMRARFTRMKGGCAPHFLLKDYEKMDFSQFDIVFAYLAPPAMPTLWHKAISEMKKGSLLLSYEFIVPNQAPDIEILIGSRQVMLYGWRF